MLTDLEKPVEMPRCIQPVLLQLDFSTCASKMHGFEGLVWSGR